MKVGAVFPQTEAGSDPSFPRRYAVALEETGCAHISAYDHVLGHRPADPGAWRAIGPYTDRDAFHEVLTLFSYMAAVTRRIELVTEVLVLPQRQAALVAKQAAEAAILSEGRLRLGVGLGWNPVEFAGMGMDFHDRGRRAEEQIAIMRRLFTEPVVSFQGRWHLLDACGINPLPPPIPIWIGGRAEAALDRAARLGDGLMLNHGVEDAPAVIARVRERLAALGRDPQSFGFAGRVRLARDGFGASLEDARRWRSAGATHLSVVTMGLGLERPEDHVDLTTRWLQAWQEAER